MRKAFAFAALIFVLSFLIIGLSSGITKSSRYGGGKDMVEELYFQAVKQNDNLKSIEDAIDNFQRKKDDALGKYAGFTNYNNRYYADAKLNAAEIGDGALRQKTIELINKSETAYKTRLTEWTNIVADLTEKEKELRDLHQQLMVMITISSIEKYQSTSLPDPSKAKEAKSDLQVVIEKIRAITR